MSWHFSQALEAAFLEANSSDGGQSVPSKSSQRRGECSPPDKTTDALTHSPFGTTCEPSTGSPGVDWWMSSLAASRARTSPLQAGVLGSKVNGRDCGEKWHGSFAKWDRDTCSWKTHQFLLLGDLEPFLATWPRWGMMRAGECWALSTPVHLTSGNESGSWPTIRSTDGERGGRGDLIQAIRGNPNSHYKTWPTPHGFSPDGRTNGPSGNELGRAVNRSMWQTPVADDAVDRKKGKMNSRGEPKLSAQVKLWPTPTVCGNYNKAGLTAKSGDGLATAVKMWGTPRASDGMKGKLRDIPADKNCRARLEDQVAQKEGAGGSLSPTWVEWLMGWPLGWTDSARSATDKFQQWCDSHGKP